MSGHNFEYRVYNLQRSYSQQQQQPLYSYRTANDCDISTLWLHLWYYSACCWRRSVKTENNGVSWTALRSNWMYLII